MAKLGARSLGIPKTLSRRSNPAAGLSHTRSTQSMGSLSSEKLQLKLRLEWPISVPCGRALRNTLIYGFIP